MATYVVLANFTEQGIKNVKDSPDRLASFRAMLQTQGVSINSAYYTVGTYDMVVAVSGPEESIMAALLKLGSLGNIRTQTLRAFSPDEMKAMIAKIP